MTEARMKNEVIWLQIDIEIAKRNGYTEIVEKKTNELKKILERLGK
jgi:hypothetical protein